MQSLLAGRRVQRVIAGVGDQLIADVARNIALDRQRAKVEQQFVTRHLQLAVGALQMANYALVLL